MWCLCVLVYIYHTLQGKEGAMWFLKKERYSEHVALGIDVIKSQTMACFQSFVMTISLHMQPVFLDSLCSAPSPQTLGL